MYNNHHWGPAYLYNLRPDSAVALGCVLLELNYPGDIETGVARKVNDDACNASTMTRHIDWSSSAQKVLVRTNATRIPKLNVHQRMTDMYARIQDGSLDLRLSISTNAKLDSLAFEVLDP